MDEIITQYLSTLLPEEEQWVKELQAAAKKDNVPIMDAISMRFLMQLMRLNKPARILEIGTAIGYSSLRILEANPTAHIVTIERDEPRYEQAVQNIQRLGKQDHITLLFGDALQCMDELIAKEHTFDCVFIDAAKGSYKQFFEKAQLLIAENGFIVSDNVLFRGYVADISLSPKRYVKMVEKIRDYNQWLSSHPAFTTTIVPTGDGVALSIKK